MDAATGFSRILVPTDFSSGSARAWRTAQSLAAAIGAELVLLHVLPVTPLDLDTRLAAEERRAELRSRQAAHQLGVPRGDASGEGADLAGPRAFEGPLTGETVHEFSVAGRQWADLLERWAGEARGTGGKVHTVLRVGVPYREIVAAVTDEGADLVVLATHGRGEIHRLLVGSVADKVIRMAPCPVLTVREA
jgi:nucleotide-binding universal stress UspA family protein